VGSDEPEGAMTSGTICAAVLFAASVTERPTLEFPAVVGVPEIVPLDSVKPAGRGLLEFIDQV
jgi:hypothetical protein